MNKKTVIIIIALILLAVLAYLGYVYYPYYTTRNITSTGKVSTYSAEENKQYNQGKKLKETLPISNDNFDLDYSYDSLLFEVKLKKPHDDNYNKFIEWLTSEYAELSP